MFKKFTLVTALTLLIGLSGFVSNAQDKAIKRMYTDNYGTPKFIEFKTEKEGVSFSTRESGDVFRTYLGLSKEDNNGMINLTMFCCRRALWARRCDLQRPPSKRLTVRLYRWWFANSSSGVLSRSFSWCVSKDRVGDLPPLLKKLGSYSGHNNSRDFARALRLPVVSWPRLSLVVSFPCIVVLGLLFVHIKL